MNDNYTRPITRDDLLFTVEMALRKAERLWPKKRLPGDHDRLRPVAERVVEHMELCGMKCFGRPRGRGHSTPDPWGRVAAGKGVGRPGWVRLGRWHARLRLKEGRGYRKARLGAVPLRDLKAADIER